LAVLSPNGNASGSVRQLTKACASDVRCEVAVSCEDVSPAVSRSIVFCFDREHLCVSRHPYCPKAADLGEEAGSNGFRFRDAVAKDFFEGRGIRVGGLVFPRIRIGIAGPLNLQ
jgi:hypothetical protein